MRYKLLAVVILLLLSISGLNAATNFTRCLEQVRNGEALNATGGKIQVGATDNHGNILEDVRNATGLTYGLSWLLPWLALVSQLPFGPKDRLENLESVLLTIGSPMLAAYSLALTVLNGRWIARRFSKHNYPNIRNAVRVLSSLQQAPLRVTNEDALLASLIVLPHNDEWWRELIEWLAYPHTWSVSAATSIAWVVVAYLSAVIGFLMEEVVKFTSHGHESLWLWLLPIVIGWLQLSPKCDEVRVRSAVERANKIAYAATETHPVLVQEHTEQRAIYLAFSEADEDDDVLRRDERVTAPIYNYARFLPWVQAVEKVSETFKVVSGRYRRHESVDPDITWVTMADRGSGRWSMPHERNRVGSASQVERYCLDPAGGITTRSRWGPDIFSQIAIASALAFLLQWGTVGAAFLSAYLTPTTAPAARCGK
ncbi:hypothetical protein EST38_g2285 [Candolleomyces aberdarensis]|uniref:Uncharacterized protein n=1 Tax=Candolleomyces aberdarensis TaxID=2316362 RepID=A0A4Q2DX45_9AGAR|nr:hypothetical protein EST38_g2285 [Candolleomyces aberdarensis]